MTVMKLRANVANGKRKGRNGCADAALEFVQAIKAMRRKRKGISRITCEMVADDLNGSTMANAWEPVSQPM